MVKFRFLLKFCGLLRTILVFNSPFCDSQKFVLRLDVDRDYGDGDACVSTFQIRPPSYGKNKKWKIEVKFPSRLERAC
jgi:hypothetical protein